MNFAWDKILVRFSVIFFLAMAANAARVEYSYVKNLEKAYNVTQGTITTSVNSGNNSTTRR